MRSIFEILESTKDGEKPTYEECYYTMLVLDALWSFDRKSLLGLLGKGENKPWRDLVSNESFRRAKDALNADPVKWLGMNVPSDPSYQSMRRAAKAVLKRVENEQKSR